MKTLRRFVLYNVTILILFNTKYPITTNNILIDRGWNKSLGFISNKRIIFLVRDFLPNWALKSLSNSFWNGFRITKLSKQIEFIYRILNIILD